MALFDENVIVSPGPPRRMSRATVAGMWALAAALVILLIITFLPTPFVIQQPGPVYNTLGTVTDSEGEETPLIAVENAETYPTTGALDLLTVQVVGSPERTPSWFELVGAWFDPTLAVVPIEAVYPTDQSAEERNEQSAALMVDSQQEAQAAALTHLGYDVEPQLTVHSLTDDSPAEGILEPDDAILLADGASVTDASTLRRIINDADGGPVELTIARDGDERTVSVTPAQIELDGSAAWVVGVTLVNDYTFPVTVTIQLDNVGGPSAGMMFALGIIDTLTPGELTGGDQIAGTGTITADGTVGAIGGIRQKLWGAQRAGAEYFLAPESNCEEVVGHVPSGIRVFSVATLGDSVDVLDAVREGGDLESLPSCGS